MKAAIIAVGTELLMGKVTNTNAVYLSSVLNELGVSVLYHLTVGDNPKRLENAVNEYFDEVDLIITTGGLGPTQDDLTKEIVSRSMGVDLAMDETLLKELEAFFAGIGRTMTSNNKKQALKPDGALTMHNSRGTAPGFIIEKNGKIAAMLPGPPSEVEAMTDSGLIPFLKSRHEEEITTVWMRVFGMGESSVENAIEDIVNAQSNPTLATYVKDGSIAIRVTANGASESENMALIMPVVNAVKERLGDVVYSLEDETLEAYVGRILIDNKIRFSLAESCTGGLLAAELVGLSGISGVFDRGYVTYSNEAKEQELGVPSETLKEHGAVSAQTAEAMVRGLREKNGSDLCVSITGIAGPNGGTDEKPVGLVYIGVYYKDRLEVFKHNFHGDRKRVRHASARSALDHIRKMIEV
jgi:nicotinamide-nucleotide amidase